MRGEEEWNEDGEGKEMGGEGKKVMIGKEGRIRMDGRRIEMDGRKIGKEGRIGMDGRRIEMDGRKIRMVGRLGW